MESLGKALALASAFDLYIQVNICNFLRKVYNLKLQLVATKKKKYQYNMYR